MAKSSETRHAYDGDLALVRGVLGGDEEAQKRFGERLACVPAFLRRLTGSTQRSVDPGDLDDFAQDVFASVWRRLKDYDGRCHLETWLWGFCRKRVLKWLERGSGGIAFGGDEQLLDLPDDAVTEPGRGVDMELLRSELARLDPELAEVVHLKHYDDLTFEAIGKRLRVSPNTVKSRYYRALEQLKTRVASLAPGDRPR